MAAPDIALIKTWCRVDGTEFDVILSPLIADVTARAGHEVAGDESYYSANVMPPSVQIWCCAQVASWLANPEAAIADQSVAENPFLERLLDPHRAYAMEVLPVVV